MTNEHVCVECGGTENIGPCYHVCRKCSDYRTPSVPTLTHEQADDVAILRETLDREINEGVTPSGYVAVNAGTLRRVLALYPNTKETGGAE